jgi:hypothetical protein
MIAEAASSWADLAEIPDPDVPPIEVRSLSSLSSPGPGDRSELLKTRYVCRGAGGLLIGPTGVGKTSFALQNAVGWALGRQSFGFEPNGIIKTLLVQAENDEGDMSEMRDGIYEGLGLTQDEIKIAGANVEVARVDSLVGRHFCDCLGCLLKEHTPDLLVIDPALAYLGGDASSQRDVGAFLRQGLNPLLVKYDCGALIIHHANKPSGDRQKPNWRAGDFAYMGAGSAEWGNWARAVISIRSIGSHDQFELTLGKRGQRLGWKFEDGITIRYTKRIAHSQEPGRIFWHEATLEEQVAAAGCISDNRPNKLHVLSLVPAETSIPKSVLISKAQGLGIGINRAKGFIAELVNDCQLYEWAVSRKGTRPEIHLSREPQHDKSKGVSG